MSAPTIHRWTASDGIDLAWRELGEGAPVVLLHGLFSDGQVNWMKFGHAAKVGAYRLYLLAMPRGDVGLLNELFRKQAVLQIQHGAGK